MRPVLQRLMCALLALAGALPASADVIDDISIEPAEAAATIRLRLTGPVRYLRHYPLERGEVVVVVLEALTPEAFGAMPPIEEVKRAPGHPRVPPFTARVSMDPACSPAANPLCITLRFERRVRYRISLGEDRRSLRVDLLPQDAAP